MLEVGSVVARLGARLDDDPFDRFDRRLHSARAAADRPITQDLRANVDGRGFQEYDRHVHDVNRSHEDLVRGSGRVKTAFGSLFIGGAAVAGAGVAMAVTAKAGWSAVKAFEASNKVAQQTNAVLKSTGGAANVTAKEIANLATQISRKTGIDDEAVQSGENMLLTFTNVRNEAGKGNDIFNQSTKILSDMSVALGTDMSTSAIQLGKALNDPIKGVTALQRVGVTFDAKTKEHIKTLVTHGKTLDAQKIILRELNKEFGGSAEAQATGTAKMSVALGNLQEAIGGKLEPAVKAVSGFINDLAIGMNDGTGAGGRLAGTLGHVGDVVGGVFTAAFKAAGAVVDGVRTVISDNRDTINDYAHTVADVAGRVWSAVQQIARGFAQTFGAGSETGQDLRNIIRVIGEFLQTVQGVVAAIVKRELPGIVTAFKGLAVVIRGVIRIIAGILTLDFGKAWAGVKDIFSGALKVLAGVLRAGTAPIRTAAAAVWGGITAGAAAAWHMVTGLVNKGVDEVAGGVSSLLGLVAKIADAASHLPFIGGKFKGLADDIHGAQRTVDSFRESLRKSNATTDDVPGKAGRAGKAMRGLGSDARTGARGIGLLGQAAGSASDVVADSAGDISRNVNSLAKSLGAAGINFTPAKTSSAQRRQLSTFGPIGQLATGGVPNAGASSADDHLVIGPDGRPVAAISGSEGIINRPQMGIIDVALGVASALGVMPYRGLDDLWGSGLRHYAGGGVMERANYLDSLHLPYVWGGHHGDRGPIRDPRPGLDCSSSVSYVLGIAPRVSGALETIGEPGAGPITVFANPTHTFMRIGSRYFGTSGFGHPEAGTGPAWFTRNPDAGYLSGFVQRHVSGDAGGISAPHINGPAGALKRIAQAAVNRMAGAGNRYASTAGGQAGGGQGLADAIGGTYGRTELEHLWTGAGGPGNLSRLAAAIALAESHGDPNAHNASGASGLWQILGQLVPGNIFNPVVNARNAVAKWRGAHGFSPWVTYTSGAYRGFMARGGRLARLAGGGPIPQGSSSRTLLEPGGNLGAMIKRLNAGQGDRIARYDAFTHRADRTQVDYTYWDRRFGLTEEELIDPDTGEVNTGAVEHRLRELLKLISLRRLIRQDLGGARDTARNVVKTYRRILRGLRGALGHVGKDKHRRAKYEARISAYGQRLAEWQGKAVEAGDTYRDAGLDLDESLKEWREVKGTAPTAKATDPGSDTSGDTGSSDTGSSDTGSSSPAAPAAPTAEQIADGVAQALATFNASRADLFASFGANFLTPARFAGGTGGGLDAAAGARYFGGGSGGSDGGVIAGAGGVTQNVYVTLQDPGDTHLLTQSALHELKAAT